MIESIKFRMWFKYGHFFIISTMPLSFTLIFVYFHERYDYMTFRKGKSKKRDAFFFNTCLIFTPLFSFNIIERRKKGAISPVSQRKSIYLQSNWRPGGFEIRRKKRFDLLNRGICNPPTK